MRWDGLFADLEGQLAQAARQAVEAESAELLRGEWSRIPLQARLRAAIGRSVRILTSWGEPVELTLQTVGPTWVGGLGETGSTLLPSAAVHGVLGALGAAETTDSATAARLGIGTVYRALARARAGCVVTDVGGRTLGEGTVDRVGADHLDLSLHPRDEGRRAGAVRGRLVVPFAAVGLLRAPHGAL